MTSILARLRLVIIVKVKLRPSLEVIETRDIKEILIRSAAQKIKSV